MAKVIEQTKNLRVTAYRGDARTLLAFDLSDKKLAKNLAGFTIACKPRGRPAYYLQNTLPFKFPAKHAQDPTEPANSSVNAPFHKFRWLHVPGSVHQGLKPYFGIYTYTVTARYLDAHGLLTPLDPSRGVALNVEVAPFVKKNLELGFTRGFSQSQAFVRHFGLKAHIRPATKQLIFDTSAVSGSDSEGAKYTYADEYEWSGFTAREKIFGILDEVLADKTLRLDVFAYDLNEPDFVEALLKLARSGRVRVILDNAALHHSTKKPTPEDKFESLFKKAACKPASILRGKFKRYAHDKVLVVSKSRGKQSTPTKVLTGSTNFSVTGMYVNSNHVLVFNDAKVAAKYASLFETVWDGCVKAKAYLASTISHETFSLTSPTEIKTDITFAPHCEGFATQILSDIAQRIGDEKKNAKASVLFAVMAIDKGTSPVYTALKTIHADGNVFSYGISDNPGGIALFAPGKKTGVLVTGKPVRTKLPPPFNQVRNIAGVGHQVHHKFVVCGFNGSDPVVYCGSSNLAIGGEESNGDNLLAIHDEDVATVFAIEALGLVDHFEFLDRSALGPAKKKTRKSPKKTEAPLQRWFLSTTDAWTKPYFDPSDIHCVDRTLFG